MCGCSFRRGRQEDAHEYLVALLDAMHEAALAGYNPKPSREVAETSLIYRIFAGQSRSQACPQTSHFPLTHCKLAYSGHSSG